MSLPLTSSIDTSPKISVFCLNDSSEVYLQKPFEFKSTLSTKEIDAFTMHSFKELAQDALINKRDFIFVLVEDRSYVLSFFDGPSFCKYVSEESKKSKFIENPYTRQEICDASFYIIYNDQKWEDIITGKDCISQLCSFREYLDYANNPFYDQLIALSDASVANARKDLIEVNLVLELLIGKGILSQRVKQAVDYAEKKGDAGNVYCKMLLSLCYRWAIGRSKDRVKGQQLYNEVLIRLEGADKIYRHMKAKLQAEYAHQMMPEFETAETPASPTSSSHRIFNPHFYQ